MKKNQFVVKRDTGWAVIGANNIRATVLTSTKKEAVEKAISIAKNQGSELRIQDRHGKFKTCNSYGGDPCPPKDKNR